jgi:hypothetical protein
MKFKKNSPFLDEVTAHGELFKGLKDAPKEVFVCPECGSGEGGLKVCFKLFSTTIIEGV